MSGCNGLQVAATASVGVAPADGELGLVTYARKHRYRLRNLHDGGQVPPVRRIGKCMKTGYVGAEDRADAIAGHAGYLVREDNGLLGIYLHLRSAKGVRRGEAQIQALGGTVTQVGDTEVLGTVPADRIEEALRIIKVSKLRPGNARNFDRGPVQEAQAS